MCSRPEVGALLLAAVMTSVPADAAVSGAERSALIAFYNATNGTGWRTRTNWRTPSDSDFSPPGTECSWYGVTCQLGQTEVVGLFLPGNQLTGSLPPDVGDLTALSALDVSSNRLTGAIPRELARIRYLHSLVLSRNELSGTIPPELSSLGSLSYLRLSSNHLTGPIPKELGNLGGMFWYLSLDGNQLTGSVPPELAQLFSLLEIDLRWNALHTEDAALLTYLNSRQTAESWETTQTVSPKSLSVEVAGDTSVPLAWKKIPYVTDGGGFRVLASTISGGPYTLAAATPSKAVLSATATGLIPDTTYYFVVETVTDPHTRNPNTVVSERSPEITARTQALPVEGLTVTPYGTGSGVVTSSPPGIDCGPACSATFAPGMVLTLTETPGPGSSFEGWTGACSGRTDTCMVTMDAAKLVTPSFAQPARYFTLTPCRAFDTRVTSQMLPGDRVTTIALAGKCGVPAEARAVSLNVTTVTGGASGHLRIFPAGDTLPLVSVINFAPLSGLFTPRANNAIVSLGASGAVDVYVGGYYVLGGSVHVVFDVNGYFE